MKAELVPENGDPPIPIVRDVSVVGRKDYCDIAIDDFTISKRHCVLVRTSGLIVLRDLATTNGTRVRGQKVRWAALLPGDKVAIGGYKVRIYLGPDDAPSPSERRANPLLKGEFGKASHTPETKSSSRSQPKPGVSGRHSPKPRKNALVPPDGPFDDHDFELEDSDFSSSLNVKLDK